MPDRSPRAAKSAADILKADTLARPFVLAAERAPGHPALLVGGDALTYGDLLGQVRQAGAGVAALRRDGVPPRVALSLGNQPELLALFFGIVAAGGVVGLLDPKWSAAQTDAALDTLRPDLHLTSGTAAGWIAAQPAGWAVPAVDPRTPFLIGFTSGTTGRPKAFIRDQGSWLATLAASRVEFGIRPGDVVLVPGPLTHGLGLYGAVEALSAGATVEVQPRFDAAAAADRLAGSGLTTLVVVPTMLVGILDAAERQGRRFPALRRVVCSGAKLAPAVHDRLVALCPDVTVLEYYGASELSFVSLRSSREGAPADSVGRPFHGVDIDLRDDAGHPAEHGRPGTVWVRSRMLSNGYLGGTDGSGYRERDGWGTVGDYGWIDEDGWLRLIGRAGDMVVSGGLNVYPAEVEAALRAHPAVAEAVVFGLPDPYWGDAVSAVVWWRGAVTATLAELRAWCRERLEAYKAPRRLFTADDMPLTGSGKIARADVREFARSGLLASAGVVADAAERPAAGKPS
ncbi:class I adenylate-forming enzyme family protein [Azospirillum picis]|uniref:Acyl-CoA synthetase (AMP-forming)/AMP-acid ligase II n=1 Tax=Azospirillum picis TaxID=488438 RepID=A0ABU0MLT3_9PROT|nr:AMP-binding protein [Azospirillum picis]MBP2300950.1 acyl-CoA synthetase (AMP-forming)/AMP-acid ligase II [Azospirillum picis]MDQ0534430.1 acyl-CoA synthetase (AMP-forming)/AMP-acid ligase II [Azospirillum picis]